MTMYKLFILFALMASTVSGCANQSNSNHTDMSANELTDLIHTDTATLGSGCFWCTEAIFQELNGVLSIESGYSGGKRANPTYDQVTSGATGHAEVTQIVYDPKKISFDELLEVFWKTHDPTTLNRQGADVGTQYRSVIFYHNPRQKELAEKYKAELNSSGAWDNPIVTEISPFTAFYKAEDYHQNYYNNNRNAAYCTFVIGPKLEKLRKVFKEKTKAGSR